MKHIFEKYPMYFSSFHKCLNRTLFEIYTEHQRTYKYYNIFFFFLVKKYFYKDFFTHILQFAVEKIQLTPIISEIYTKQFEKNCLKRNKVTIETYMYIVKKKKKKKKKKRKRSNLKQYISSKKQLISNRSIVFLALFFHGIKLESNSLLSIFSHSFPAPIFIHTHLYTSLYIREICTYKIFVPHIELSICMQICAREQYSIHNVCN